MSHQQIQPVPVHEETGIMGPYNKLNGRINIVEQPSTDILFRMQEKIGIKNVEKETKSPLNLLLNTLNHIKNKNQLLIFPLTVITLIVKLHLT
jgi:hypothetical protein